MYIAPLAPRVTDTCLLQSVAAGLLNSMIAALELPPPPGADRFPNAAATARAQAKAFQAAAAALLKLVQADPQRMREVLAAPMVDEHRSFPAWPEVHARLRGNTSMRQTSHLGARQALDALAASIAGSDGRRSQQDGAVARVEGAAEAAADAAAAALLQVIALAHSDGMHLCAVDSHTCRHEVCMLRRL